MDAETMKLLQDAEMALKTVKDDGVMIGIGLFVVIGLTIWYLSYLLDRWSWTPRKRHNRVFNERF